MQYLLLVYTDPELMAKLPEAEFNDKMRHCLKNAARSNFDLVRPGRLQQAPSIPGVTNRGTSPLTCRGLDSMILMIHSS